MKNRRHRALQHSTYVSAGSNSFGNSRVLPRSFLFRATVTIESQKQSPIKRRDPFLSPSTTCFFASRRRPRPSSFARASYVASGHWQGRARAPPRPSSVVGSRRLGHEIRSAQATAGRRTRDQPRAGACSMPAYSALPPATHRSGRSSAPASSSTKPSSSPILLPTS